MESIKLYLRDIKNIPLLTPEEELRLARRIRRGDAAARRKMIQSNLRLVINIAKRYASLGVPIMDLVEEGNLGLMKAITKFNPNRGYRLSTYAAWWIKQYITRAIANQGKTIRIPIYMTETIAKWRRVTEALSQRYGRKPTLKEVARTMRIPIKKVQELTDAVTQVSSLDAPIGDDGTSHFIDVIEDAAAAPPTEGLSDLLRRERVNELLERLSERERQILVLRYGVRDGVSRTLGETAKFFGITRERVRQIENVALKKLRAYLAERGEAYSAF